MSYLGPLAMASSGDSPGSLSTETKFLDGFRLMPSEAVAVAVAVSGAGS